MEKLNNYYINKIKEGLKQQNDLTSIKFRQKAHIVIFFGAIMAVICVGILLTTIISLIFGIKDILSISYILRIIIALIVIALFFITSLVVVKVFHLSNVIKDFERHLPPASIGIIDKFANFNLPVADNIAQRIIDKIKPEDMVKCEQIQLNDKQYILGGEILRRTKDNKALKYSEMLNINQAKCLGEEDLQQLLSILQDLELINISTAEDITYIVQPLD